MTDMARRVERLERKTAEAAGVGDLVMIEGPDSYRIDQALAELGIALGNNSVVIYLCGRGDSIPVRRL